EGRPSSPLRAGLLLPAVRAGGGDRSPPGGILLSAVEGRRSSPLRAGLLLPTVRAGGGDPSPPGALLLSAVRREPSSPQGAGALHFREGDDPSPLPPRAGFLPSVRAWDPPPYRREQDSSSG